MAAQVEVHVPRSQWMNINFTSIVGPFVHVQVVELNHVQATEGSRPHGLSPFPHGAPSGFQHNEYLNAPTQVRDTYLTTSYLQPRRFSYSGRGRSLIMPVNTTYLIIC